ncbi:hypothetical protein R5R35_000892 [Gryllus longicercus]|uniref:Uncharacterized protein n=1 Tax=Gryllus longicercus TaxID=2509291 RepID=A0AAN9ZC44_9ORTH
MASKQSGVRRVIPKVDIDVHLRHCIEHCDSSSEEDISDDSCYTDSDCDYDDEDDDFLKACCILDDRLLLYFQQLYTNNSERKAMAAKNADELVAEEEREKRKAEKRKAKKKRRKEKKKEEKERCSSSRSEYSSDMQEGSERRNAKSSVPAPDTPSFSSTEDAEDGEEFLDVNSAFVSVAVSKKKKNSALATGMEKTRPNSKKTQVSADQVVAESERLAVIGYKLASKEQYEQAVEFFTKAIRLVHDDHRFFSNRSFCHCQLGNYTKALKDADKAINLAPNNPKGYYRRGEALKGLNQFKEAQEAFERVVELDEECEDAVHELKFVKLQQLLEMGYPEKQASAALQQYHSVQAAINVLSINPISENYVNNSGREVDTEIFFSDEEESVASVSSLQQNQDTGGQQNLPVIKANKMDPSNPEGHLSLWVGNVSQEVTEKQLIEMFSKFGVVLSVRLLPEKYCAFINFRDKSSPGPAMKSLQNRELGGERLLIRYPNNPVPEAHQQIVVKKVVKTPVAGSVQTKVTGPVNGDECHFWRTTGCAFGNKCRYKHLKENKGIDKKPWQKAS